MDFAIWHNGGSMENSIYEKDYAEEHEKNRQSEDVDILA